MRQPAHAVTAFHDLSPVSSASSAAAAARLAVPSALSSLAGAACLALALLGAGAAQADSLASSASSAGSKVSGSVSDSLGASSNSSTGEKKVAQGQYRVTQVAALDDIPGRPAQVVLTLQGREAGTTPEFTLKLPRAAMGERMLAQGDLVQVRERGYGYDFARADAPASTATTSATSAREPFFLVLKDEWHRELGAQVVTL